MGCKTISTTGVAGCGRQASFSITGDDMIEITTDSDMPWKIFISGEMTIYGAETMASRLTSCLSTEKNLEIDLSGVTEVDSTGIQIMYAIQREAMSSAKKIVWTKHSDAVLQIIRLFNLGSSFGEPVSLEWN